MPECIQCKAYTKFENGLCYKCFKKEDNPAEKIENYVEEVIVVEEPVKKKEKKKENSWITGVIKGRIAETIIEELFRSLDFQVFSYGMENSIPGIKDLLKGIKDDVAKNIRQMPDFVVFKDKRAHFIEVKYRASGELKLSDIEKHGEYPFENALFVLVTKQHIKCISYSELKAGKEIKEGDRKFLGKRVEFDTDKEKIIEYCKYAVKFFENV